MSTKREQEFERLFHKFKKSCCIDERVAREVFHVFYESGRLVGETDAIERALTRLGKDKPEHE